MAVEKLAKTDVSGPAAAVEGSRELSVWRCANFVLDEATLELKVDGSVVPIEPKPLEMLLWLLRHAGEVVTKTDILRAVWDAHYEGEVNVVEVYVGYLRRKIDAPFGTSSIETLRGVGYRMADPVAA